MEFTNENDQLEVITFSDKLSDDVNYLNTDKEWILKEFGNKKFGGRKCGEYDGYDVFSYVDYFVYIVQKDINKIVDVIGIYELHSCSVNERRGIVNIVGHEESIQFFFDDHTIDHHYTR